MKGIPKKGGVGCADLRILGRLLGVGEGREEKALRQERNGWGGWTTRAARAARA